MIHCSSGDWDKVLSAENMLLQYFSFFCIVPYVNDLAGGAFWLHTVKGFLLGPSQFKITSKIPSSEAGYFLHKFLLISVGIFALQPSQGNKALLFFPEIWVVYVLDWGQQEPDCHCNCNLSLRQLLYSETWKFKSQGWRKLPVLKEIPGCGNICHFVSVATWNCTEVTEHPLCVNHPFVHCFLNIVAVTVRFSSHCCLFSVNCYLNPESLPLSLCHQRGTGEGEHLIRSLS